MWSRVRSLWRNTVHRHRVDSDLEEEVGVAFDLAVDEHVRNGLDRDHARRQARLQFGQPATVAAQVRDARAGAWLDALRQDVTVGVRLLGRAPLFALTAVVSLALGIGATTTIFTLVNALMLRDLRVGDPEQLVEIGRITQYRTRRRLLLSHLPDAPRRQHGLQRHVRHLANPRAGRHRHEAGADRPVRLGEFLRRPPGAAAPRAGDHRG